MQWTDEQIGDIRKLASEGFTRRETADKLGISYDALQGKGLVSNFRSHWRMNTIQRKQIETANPLIEKSPLMLMVAKRSQP